MAVKASDTITLAKVDDGENGTDGRVFLTEVSASVVKAEAEKTLSPSYLKFESYYRDGASTSRKTYAGRFKIEETTDGSTWTVAYQSSTNESAITHSLYSFLVDSSGNVIVNSSGYGIGVKRDVAAIRCSVYAAGGFTSLLDRQTITVVKSVEALTHEDIFNLLTNNGLVKGIYKEGNQLFVNATYIRSGAFIAGGAGNKYGRYEVRDANDNVIGYWDKDGFVANNGNFSGKIAGSTVTGSKIETGALGNEKTKIVIENATQKFYTLWEGVSEHSGVIKPSTVDSAYIPDDELIIEGELPIIGLYGAYGIVLSTMKNSKPVMTVSPDRATVTGDFFVNGVKSRVTESLDYGKRCVYCYEMPTPAFGDFGTGQIDENGECYVSIDDMFSTAINTSVEYAVFIQKEGQGDIWVSKKEPDYFVVQGTPGLPFSWEMKALQRDYEYYRQEDIYMQPVLEDEDDSLLFDEELADYDEELEQFETEMEDML